jgi:nitrogen fixation NifU-like protein
MTEARQHPEVDELYQAAIVDHDRWPRNCGPLADATHHATVDNPLCGDVITVHARIIDGAVQDITFEGRGCVLSRAAASIMTTMVGGRTTEASRRLATVFEQFVQAAPDTAIPDELADLRVFAGVRRFRTRRVCAMLAFRTLVQALDADA